MDVAAFLMYLEFVFYISLYSKAFLAEFAFYVGDWFSLVTVWTLSLLLLSTEFYVINLWVVEVILLLSLEVIESGMIGLLVETVFSYVCNCY